MKGKKEKSQGDVEWENRTLCSDESCIGVIGPDGRCKECGLPFGQEQTEKHHQEQQDTEAADEFDQPNDEDHTTDDEEANSREDIDWENRTLCSDESCIGVIGPDGRCNECGKPFEG